jgi:transcriptional regulator with XRE-family HTH domain
MTSPNTLDSTDTFGKRLSALMKQRNLTAITLADKMGLHAETIRDWMKGEVHPYSHGEMFRLSKALGLVDFSPNQNLWELVKLYDPQLDSANPVFQHAFLTHEGNFALDKDWLNTQPKEKQFGLFLRACREDAGLTQQALAQQLKTSWSNISLYEHGDNGISMQMLAKAVKALGMHEPDQQERLAQLLKLRSPELDWKKDDYKLLHVFIENKGLLHLDPGQMETVATEKRFGTFLKACCEKSGLSIMEIERRSGVSDTTIRKWQDDGDVPDTLIDVFKVCDTIGMLESKNKDNLKLLLSFCKPDVDWNLDAEQLQIKFKQTKGLMALDDDWLNIQNQDKQFGMYLDACLLSTKTDRKEIATKLEISPKTIALWVVGKNKPFMKDFFATIEEMGILLGRTETSLYEAHAKKAKRLLELYDPEMDWSLQATTLQQAFKKTKGLLPLDKQWLATQEPDMRFGLYLAACQSHMGIGVEKVAEAAGRSPSVVGDWKKGLRIPSGSGDGVISGLVKLFNEKVPDFNREYFTELYHSSQEAVLKKREENATATNLEKNHMCQFLRSISSDPELGRG